MPNINNSTRAVQSVTGKSSHGTGTYIPVDLNRHIRSLGLTGSQYDLLFFLWEFDPSGKEVRQIPSPEEIGLILNQHPRTVQRNAQRLEDLGLFEFEVKSWGCRNKHGQKTTYIDQHFYSGKEIPIQAKRSIDSGPKQLEPNKDGIDDVPVLKPLNTLVSSGTATPEEQDSNLVRLLKVVESAEIDFDARTIGAIEFQLLQGGVEAAESILHKALSAYQEQINRGIQIENPDGWLGSAIRRGFTSNAKKREKRLKLKVGADSGERSRSSSPPPGPSLPPPTTKRIEEEQPTNRPPTRPMPIIKVTARQKSLNGIEEELVRLDWSRREALTWLKGLYPQFEGKTFHKFSDEDLEAFWMALRGLSK